MRIVLDTNIIMDMLHFANPHTLPIRKAINRGDVQCFTDASCLAELMRVSAYPAFALSESARQRLLADYREFAIACEADGEENHALPRCRDRDDQKFLILAARCRADLLLTRDKLVLKLARHRHKPLPYAVLTAEAACALLPAQ